MGYGRWFISLYTLTLTFILIFNIERKKKNGTLSLG